MSLGGGPSGPGGRHRPGGAQERRPAARRDQGAAVRAPGADDKRYGHHLRRMGQGRRAGFSGIFRGRDDGRGALLRQSGVRRGRRASRRTGGPGDAPLAGAGCPHPAPQVLVLGPPRRRDQPWRQLHEIECHRPGLAQRRCRHTAAALRVQHLVRHHDHAAGGRTGPDKGGVGRLARQDAAQPVLPAGHAEVRAEHEPRPRSPVVAQRRPRTLVRSVEPVTARRRRRAAAEP